MLPSLKTFTETHISPKDTLASVIVREKDRKKLLAIVIDDVTAGSLQLSRDLVYDNEDTSDLIEQLETAATLGPRGQWKVAFISNRHEFTPKSDYVEFVRMLWVGGQGIQLTALDGSSPSSTFNTLGDIDSVRYLNWELACFYDKPPVGMSVFDYLSRDSRRFISFITGTPETFKLVGIGIYTVCADGEMKEYIETIKDSYAEALRVKGHVIFPFVLSEKDKETLLNYFGCDIVHLTPAIDGIRIHSQETFRSWDKYVEVRGFIHPDQTLVAFAKPAKSQTK